MESVKLLSKLQRFVNSEEKRRLMSNFFSLSILQGVNYIFPLITFPYLVRVLGVEYFGLLTFATAIIAYFQIITDYGFNLTATREISIHRDNKAKLTEIFSSVMTIKVILMILSIIILSIIVFSFEKFAKDWLVYYLTFGTVIGQVLFPVWFFQGIERMKYITYLNVISKLIFTLAVFILVHKKDDYIIVPLLTSLGAVIPGLWSLVIIKKKFGVVFVFQRFENILVYLKEGWHVFLSQLNISLFNQTNVIILGLLTNNTAVGYYSAAEKIMRALAMLQTPITNAIFPYISLKINNNKQLAFNELKKIVIITTIGYFVLLSNIFIFSEHIITFLYNSNMIGSIIVLKIMSFIPLTIFLNNIFGTQIMLNTGKEKEFFYVLLIGGMVNLILVSILSYFFSYIGAAISLLLVEIYIMLGMFFCVRKDFCDRATYSK